MTKNSIEGAQEWAVVCESTDSGVPIEDIVGTYPTEQEALEEAQLLNEQYGLKYEPFEGGSDMPPYHTVRQVQQLGAEAVGDFSASQQQVESVEDDLGNLCDNCGAPKDSSYCCGKDY